MGRPKWWPDLTLPGRLEVNINYAIDIRSVFECFCEVSRNLESISKLERKHVAHQINASIRKSTQSCPYKLPRAIVHIYHV